VSTETGFLHRKWPASEYLARMASIAPAEVFDVLENIKTNNAMVIRDVCRAATAMASEQAEILARKVIKALKAEVYVWPYMDEAARLIVMLAERGRVKTGFRLAAALFDIRSDPSGSEVNGLVAPYHYRELLEKVAPVLGRANAELALKKCCRLLKKAVSKKAEDFDDGSWYWRPAVERQERAEDLAQCLVGVVCSLAEQVVRDGSLTVAETVALLEKHRRLVFSRLALHITGEFATQDTDRARSKMLNRALFDDSKHLHEYAMLLKKAFRVLRADEQLVILGWIEEGIGGCVIPNRLGVIPEMSLRRGTLRGELPDGSEIA